MDCKCRRGVVQRQSPNQSLAGASSRQAVQEAGTKSSHVPGLYPNRRGPPSSYNDMGTINGEPEALDDQTDSNKENKDRTEPCSGV